MIFSLKSYTLGILATGPQSLFKEFFIVSNVALKFGNCFVFCILNNLVTSKKSFLSSNACIGS